LCHGDTPLPRGRLQHPALALAALAAAIALAGQARAQSPSPFEPSLTDPRNAQRFGTPEPTTRSTAAAVTPSSIVPPSGAGETGFDSTGALGKKKKMKKRAGDPRPPPPPPPPLPGPPQVASGHGSAPQIKVRAGYADAYKQPDAPVRRPQPPQTDAFEPLGLRISSFIVKPSVEINRGVDSNPSRGASGAAAGYTEVLPALKLQSNWSRHEYSLDLRGSYSQYDKDASLNRPMFDAKSSSRIDVSNDTRINTESRFYLSTDYPGSPNLPVDFAKLPVFYSYGTTVGVTQRFNHLELSVKGSSDRTQYESTQLVDGSTSSNTDRNYNQYGGAARVSYEVFPGVKPFVELGGDVRKHDLKVDRDGFERDSRALVPRAGTTFDIAQKLKGELSVGYMMRKFEDRDLSDLNGIVADASLVWTASGLTTVTLTATSRAEETVLPAVSGALRRDIGVQVDHALRRWLMWTVRAGYGLDDYRSTPCECSAFLHRIDNRTSLGTALVYKFNREVSLKGEYRYDQLRSNTAGADYDANVFLVGLKLQR
jgi:hypothetical protein